MLYAFLLGLAVAGLCSLLMRGDGQVSPAAAQGRSQLNLEATLVSGEKGALTITDPVLTQRTIRITGTRRPGFAGLAGQGPPTSSLRPLEPELRELSVEERGGINTCERPDPGYGIFREWVYPRGYGRLLLPREPPADGQGSFDLITQFHGADLARLEYVRADVPAVMLAVRAGPGTSYPTMSGRRAFESMVESVERSVRTEYGLDQAHAAHIALASWSGGFSGTRLLLQQSEGIERVDAVVLLDSLHTSRENVPVPLRLGPFIEFAKRAVAGEVFMFMSYSSIPTDGFASTTETARMLIAELGGHPVVAEGDGPGGLRLKEVYSEGNFHARGYLGGGKLDHCAHLLLYPEVAQALYRRWHP